MWMRTTMNYQYRYGTSTTQAMKHLWKEGGILRFYRGYAPALLQGPISRQAGIEWVLIEILSGVVSG